jgi:hypothetical protein
MRLLSPQAKPAPVKVGGPSASKVPQLLAQQLSGQRQYPLDAAAPAQWELQPEQSLPDGQAVHNGGILRLAIAGERLDVTAGILISQLVSWSTCSVFDVYALVYALGLSAWRCQLCTGV